MQFYSLVHDLKLVMLCSRKNITCFIANLLPCCDRIMLYHQLH